jgi:chitin synthase
MLFNFCVHQDGRELTYMRYSASTGGLNGIQETISPSVRSTMAHPRRAKLYIVMTMSNEDDRLFTRTTQGVIAYLCRQHRSREKVVVHIVSDSRWKINSRTLGVVAAIGAYQEGIVALCSIRHPVEQDRRLEERNCPGADHPLLEEGLED